MQDLLAEYRAAIAPFLERLERIPADKLAYVPWGAVWSPGQVMHHCLVVANNAASTAGLALQLPWPHETGEMNAAGLAAFATGVYSPTPLKMFLDDPVPEHPTSADELRQAFHVQDQMMENRAKSFAEIIATRGPGNRRQHPHFGFLSGPEWFRVAALHYRHHLPQLDKLLVFSR